MFENWNQIRTSLEQWRTILNPELKPALLRNY
jgi:hypothetical protein